MTPASREYNFDGLVGPTHNYAGLSRGNLASARHRDVVSNPRAAARQGLAKMARLSELGVGQALLLPQDRPDTNRLRRCGFGGSDEDVLCAAGKLAPDLLWRLSSASAMWTANAATVAPSCDARDGRVHLVPANLVHMFHRSVEVETTTALLRAIFADRRYFEVHDALPAHLDLADEGAANHTRLFSGTAVAHVFAWGRSPNAKARPGVHPARQARAASEAVARLNMLPRELTSFWQQHPHGIDQGAFHSDVLMVGNADFLMLHEFAVSEPEALLLELEARLGNSFRSVLASEAELPVKDAVLAYPFNSQVVTQSDGSMLVIAPSDSAERDNTRRFLERVVSEDNPISQVEYLDVRQSMSNGGGPACLRLRVVLSPDERAAIAANVFIDPALLQRLEQWVDAHYRDRLALHDLCDPMLLDEGRRALDELTQITGLGSVYEFQKGSLATALEPETWAIR